jgi:hypothetical protein
MKTVLFILSSLAASLLLGFIAFGIEHLFWLIILFTAGLSFATVATIISIGELLKYKNKTVMVITVFIGCSLAYVSMDIYQYVSFIKQVKTEIESAKEIKISFSDASMVANEFLKDETKHTGFKGFLTYESTLGVKLLSPDKEIKGKNSYITYWGLKIIEAIIVLGVACIGFGIPKEKSSQSKEEGLEVEAK